MTYSINMAIPLTIIIIDKGGELKTIAVKDYKEEELYKKCGFKKGEGFFKQVEWSVKMDGQKYIISMYGKLDGKANMENKYDFPPPVDTKLYFGSCTLVGMTKTDTTTSDTDNTKSLCNLSIPLWNKIYEKLFGGFEDLSSTAIDDEMEVDELENVPKSKKTKKGGYLKDGFVVDTSSSDDENENKDADEDDDDEEINLEDIGSELSEEEYDYSDDDK
jgi:hypothetical protein